MAEFLNLITIRRSDHDDCEGIQALVSYHDSSERFFGCKVNIVKLIEISYLSVTALDHKGNIIAFAVFEDHPPGLQNNDSKHENYWESWYELARGLNDELTSINTLFLHFFVINEVDSSLHSEVLSKIFQSAYYSLPTIKGIMLLARGEASEDDFLAVGFENVKDKFELMDLYHNEVLSEVKGVHFSSKFFYSDRRAVIPQLEIRIAREEDHDDLAAVFNAQSDVVTSTHGEYFIAELIAAQNESSRSLVAQKNEKAVGLLSITSEIDTQLLWQCFELDPYDNLLDPDYMDIVRDKRAQIVEKRRIEAEHRAKEEAKKLREETMICNIVAQRIALQEHLLSKAPDIFAKLDERIVNEEITHEADRRLVIDMIADWLQKFKIQHPSDYFIDHPSDDPTLVCNILSEQDFFLECLGFFGLPEGYLDGEGHWVDWYRKKEEESKINQTQKGATFGAKRGRRDMKRGDKKVQEESKVDNQPESFDLEPLRKALKAFCEAAPDQRARLRQEIQKNQTKLEFCFKKDEVVDKDLVHVNTTNFAVHLEKAGFNFDPTIAPIIGPTLRCFGLLNTRNDTKLVQPPQPVEEEKKQKNPRARGRGQQEKEQKVQMSMVYESDVIVEFQKNREGQLLPTQVTLMKTSFNEVIKSLSIIEDYDRTLHMLGYIRSEEINIEMDQRSPEAKFNQDSEDDDIEELMPVTLNTPDKSPGAQFTFDNKEELYKHTVEYLDDLDTIPEPPEMAKNAFCLVLYCIDEAFDSFGIEFLETAFEQFPEREYMIITQPHTCPENSLMSFFTLVDKKPSNTFSHVLYIMHRDCLMYKNLKVQRATERDLDKADYLLSTQNHPEELSEKIKKSIEILENPLATFAVHCNNDLVGLFVMTKDINIKYYQSHFDIEEFIIIKEHPREAHTRLCYSLLNPIFLKCQRLIIKDILRLMNKTCMYFEINDMTVIPTVFHELFYARVRKFPHFLNKPWDHEKAVDEEPDGLPNQDGIERRYRDEKESCFGLCFITKKLLSEPKIIVSHRIVVVGASDTGLSFIESLLSNMYLRFTNIYLLAPGGLPYYHMKSDDENMRASSTSYLLPELVRLMLESRVTVIDARLVEVEREDKRIKLNDDTMIKYDILVLTMGLNDSILQQIGRVSRGIAPVPENKIYLDGIMSIDDPYLYQHFRPNGNLMAILNHRKQPGTTVVYGFTLHVFCFVQGLIHKGISPTRIKIVIPPLEFEEEEGVDPLFGGDENVLANHPAFENDEIIEEKVFTSLRQMGVQIFKNFKLKNVNTDEKNNLNSLVFYNSEEEKTIMCKILVTAGRVDVDHEVFYAIHNNGLVFNGRVIVNNQFLTTDSNIYAAGSLCEFSQQFKHLSPGRCLRMDRYNGREIGVKLSRSVLGMIEIDSLKGLFEDTKDEMHYFYMPRGKGGVLPGGFFYYFIQAPKYADPKEIRNKPKNRPDVISDTLKIDANGASTGHYIKFTFSNIGLVESVTYLSKEPIEVPSLWRFVGLSETYLNKLSERFNSKLLPDVAEFLSENWAIAVYHDKFAEFSNDIKIELKENIKDIIDRAKVMVNAGQELTQEAFKKYKEMIPRDAKRMIQERTLRYIKSHLNHLPMYYIPGVEFA